MRRIYILLAAIWMMIPVAADACTSVIIAGSASPDGRPIMWKHRDTGTLDNRLEHFKGEKYSFIGLVNSPSEGGEVWIGSNTAGFSIMNTASYCLKDDDVPSSQMDKEGLLMYRALGICACLEDFEHFLDTLTRPMGVEANFGCIDAQGGAAYYETWNDGYIKRDVCGMQEGYCVVTNFSVNGRREDWKGVERYRTATQIFARLEKDDDGRFNDMDPRIIMDSLSRSYEHQGDSLYIPRYITSASVVIHGVKKGEAPLNIVMWSAIGYPDSAVMIPVPVTEEDHIPYYLKKTPQSDNCLLCDMSMTVKRDIFPEGRDGPLDFDAAGSSVSVFTRAEACIRADFLGLYDDYISGKMRYKKYIRRYDKMSLSFLNVIKESYDSYFTYHK